MQQFWKKNTKKVYRRIQVVDFNTNYTSNLEFIIPDIYVTKGVMRRLHMEDLQGCHKYEIIVGHEIFPN